jgi:hypothetical protein
VSAPDAVVAKQDPSALDPTMVPDDDGLELVTVPELPPLNEPLGLRQKLAVRRASTALVIARYA